MIPKKLVNHTRYNSLESYKFRCNFSLGRQVVPKNWSSHTDCSMPHARTCSGYFYILSGLSSHNFATNRYDRHKELFNPWLPSVSIVLNVSKLNCNYLRSWRVKSPSSLCRSNIWLSLPVNEMTLLAYQTTAVPSSQVRQTFIEYILHWAPTWSRFSILTTLYILPNATVVFKKFASLNHD